MSTNFIDEMKMFRLAWAFLLVSLCTQCQYITEPDYNLIIDGNSHAASPYFAEPLQLLFKESLHTSRLFSRTHLYKFGVGGQTTNDMLADAAQQVDSVCSLPSHKRNILVVWENWNDLHKDSTCSGAESFQRIKTYCQGRKAASPQLLIVVGTPTPDAYHGAPRNFETRRQECRRLLRQAYARHEPWLNAVADVGGDSIINPTNRALSLDGAHYTPAGYKYINQRFTAAIDEALFKQTQPAAFTH